MKFSKNIFIPFIFLIFYAKIASEDIKENIYNRILLDGDTHKIKLDFNNYDYIGVEIILSHPSKYTTTFNPYETIVISNSTNFLIQDHSFGKSKLVIEKNKSIMQNNLYILFKLKNGQDNKNCFAFLKYNYITNIEDEKYNITNPNITLNEGNKTFKINFEGINPNGNIYNLENITTNFYIGIFEKKTLQSFCENFYISFYEPEIGAKALNNKTIEKKGEEIKDSISLEIEGYKVDNNAQILLIYAKVEDTNNPVEYILHYKYLQIGSEEDAHTDDNNNQDLTDEKVNENREKNKLLFYIIMAVFVGIIIITFIIVFSYIKCHNNKNVDDIEEETDYSNIGGIRANRTYEDKTDDDKTADE